MAISTTLKTCIHRSTRPNSSSKKRNLLNQNKPQLPSLPESRLKASDKSRRKLKKRRLVVNC